MAPKHHQHSTTESPQHGLPFTSVEEQHLVTNADDECKQCSRARKIFTAFLDIALRFLVCPPHNDCQHAVRLKQEMDKYSHKEGRGAHSRKLRATTARESQQQMMVIACDYDTQVTSLKPLRRSNSSTKKDVGQPAPIYSDSNDPLQYLHPRDTQFSKGRLGGIPPCLYPPHAPASADLAKKRTPERNCCHSAPTQNSETVAATLIGTKNDFISWRTARENGALSPTGVAQSQLKSQAQLMDVLKRVQKLEDLQHTRNVELAKVG